MLQSDNNHLGRSIYVPTFSVGMKRHHKNDLGGNRLILRLGNQESDNNANFGLARTPGGDSPFFEYRDCKVIIIHK